MVRSELSGGFSGACGGFSEGLAFTFGPSGAFSATTLLSIPHQLLLLNPGAPTSAKPTPFAGRKKSLIQKPLNLSPLHE